ncbi:MAG: hypothetical protein IJ083_17295 [Clostridia bacterium]|nr:hypothetical protein [Clostridia bacterium]
MLKAAQRTGRPVLIMSLPGNSPELCRAAFDSGADVVKVHINVEHRASGTHFGSFEEEKAVLREMLGERKGPMGLVPGGSPEAVRRDLEAASELPFSFYSVYAHHMPASALLCGVPLMAACDGSYSLEEIRQMPGLGCDVLEASIMPGSEYGQPLTMRDLVRYHLITRSVSVPVVVPTQRAILPEEVPILAKCRVAGVMIGAVVTGREKESMVRAIRAFRRAIDAIEMKG